MTKEEFKNLKIGDYVKRDRIEEFTQTDIGCDVCGIVVDRSTFSISLKMTDGDHWSAGADHASHYEKITEEEYFLRMLEGEPSNINKEDWY